MSYLYGMCNERAEFDRIKVGLNIVSWVRLPWQMDQKGIYKTYFATKRQIALPQILKTYFLIMFHTELKSIDFRISITGKKRDRSLNYSNSCKYMILSVMLHESICDQQLSFNFSTWTKMQGSLWEKLKPQWVEMVLSCHPVDTVGLIRFSQNSSLCSQLEIYIIISIIIIRILSK